TPGGAIAASFMGYNLAKRFSKDKESFGKGRIEGVFAPETAAHASGTSALLPMLALGIPGSGTAAILLGGLMVWGLNPGPLLFVEHKDFVWGLIASMYLGNVVGLVLVLTTVPVFASILRVPFAAVAPGKGVGLYTTLRCRSSAISSLPKPNSASTSSVCSPNSGGRAAILLGVRDSVTGWPTSWMCRFSSLGTCWAMPRCLTWASSNIWSMA